MLVLGLLLVAIISLLGFGLSSVEPREASSRAACGGNHIGPGTESPFHRMRNEVYDRMEADFYDKGAEFLFGDSATSQSLKLSDIFELRNGQVKPVLKPARPPVRANVLRMDPAFAASIQSVVKDHIMHHFRGGVWLQDASVYHMSMFHASHHVDPVAVTEKQLRDELRATKGVAQRLCPLRVSLDRILLTSTGVLMACWQVLEGTDPAELRDELKDALPHAPKKQMYDRVMLHTSLARILAPPIWPDGTLATNAESAMPIFRSIVSELNQRLCRKQSVVNELWNVEELDLLALALQGRMKIKKFNLSCIQPDWVPTI